MSVRPILRTVPLILLIMAARCDKDSSRSVTDEEYIVDSAAVRSFTAFFNQHRDSLAMALMSAGFHPEGPSDSTLHFDVHVSRSLPATAETGGARASISFSGQVQRYGIKLPRFLSLEFERNSLEGSWMLVLQNGYLLGSGLDTTGDAQGLPPEIHMAVKRVFPAVRDIYSPDPSGP